MFLFPGGKPTKKSIGYTLGNSIVRPLKKTANSQKERKIDKIGFQPSFFRGELLHFRGVSRFQRQRSLPCFFRVSLRHRSDLDALMAHHSSSCNSGILAPGKGPSKQKVQAWRK